ncbi:MAG: peptide-methionine (S)-S-oxide reductase [Candidatus Vogelbacteria bacterium]|nr:peptide-methionine (S)-S-oxide reductase [Candidatus Vogelbacteria bacterium]
MTCEKATFALGCFWQPEDFFSKLRGVIKTTVGAGVFYPAEEYHQKYLAKRQGFM